MARKQNFRVVIVGGSIAGLTLAHCLVRHNIDFVLLEACEEIAPQEGASVSIFPAACLSLDQLGILDDILDQVEPLKPLYNWNPKGKLLAYTEVPAILQKRHAYPGAFLARQSILQILYKHLGDRQDAVLTGRKVVSVEHFHTHVAVNCADGSSFNGDLVVGADGVRSIVRQSMWSHMDCRGLQKEAQQESERLTCEYNCVFGISSPTPGVPTPDIHRTYAQGWSMIVVAGKDEVYWFIFTRLDRKYHGHEIPRFNPDEIDKHLAPYMSSLVTNTVPFFEVYKRTKACNWLALEEALYKHWCIDRFAIIGDAAHKMAPNSGQGGNTAVETSVSLSNNIASMLKKYPDIQTKDINDSLKDWQEARKPRVTQIWQTAAEVIRLETLTSFKYKIIQHFLPILIVLVQIKGSTYAAAAEKINCLPLPPRSFTGTMPFRCQENLEQVIQEKFWKRVLWSLPLFGLMCIGAGTVGATILNIRPHAEALLENGTWTASTGEVFSIHKPIYTLQFMNDIFQPIILCFLPSITGTDPQSWTQMFSFIPEFGAVYAIWLLEGYRKANSWRAVLFPIFMGQAAQLLSVAAFGPLYYLLQYLQLSLYKTAPSNNREIDPTCTYTLLAALTAAHYIPSYASFLVPDLQERKWWNAAWQIFPLTVPLLQLPLSLFLRTKLDSEAASVAARAGNRKSSLAAIRVVYCSLAVISAFGFVYARENAPVGSSILDIFWPGVTGYALPGDASFEEGIARFMQYDQISSMGAGFGWLGLRLRELRRSGVEFSWLGVFSGLVGITCLFGPGTAFLLGWGFKEELLHRLGG